MWVEPKELSNRKRGLECCEAECPQALMGVDRPAAFLYVSHHQAIEQRLAVMDSTALSLCMDNGLPIYVFNMDDEGNIDRIVCGERVGTVVSGR